MNITPIDLQQFTGTENYFKSQLSTFWYTDGCQFFFKNGGNQGAYWVLDVVQFEVLHHNTIKYEEFVVVEIDVNHNKAVIKVQDGNDKYLFEMNIEYTDLSDGMWKFYIEVAECGGVSGKLMMLPSER